MYPNLYYAFKDIFGLEWNWLRIFNSFGFFVAIAFVVAAIILTKELKRKEREGLLQYTEVEIAVGKGAGWSELLLNFLLGFIFGYKIVGLFISKSPLAKDPQSFIFSLEGSLPMGLILGLTFAGIKWWEKKKQKMTTPGQRKVRIWPHDRVGDIVIYAAIFGFVGAKIFHNLENWSDLMKDPVGSLASFSGLTFYGGLICAGALIIYYSRKHKISIWPLCDAMAPALMIAYAIGRIGCQVSGDGDWGVLNSAYITSSQGEVVPASPETFQRKVDENRVYFLKDSSMHDVPHVSMKAPSFLPVWTVAYSFPHNVIKEGSRIHNCNNDYCYQLVIPVIPTSFYETIACTILFLVLWFLRKRLKIPGQLFGVYLVLNGIERFFIEKIRVNTRYNIFGFHPTQAEIISTILVFAGLAVILIRRKKSEIPAGQPV